MNVIVVFELDDKTEATMTSVNAGLSVLGYKVGWRNAEDNTAFFLPKNVLFKMNISLQDSFNEIRAFMVARGLTMPRCIVLPSAPWNGVGLAPTPSA